MPDRGSLCSLRHFSCYFFGKMDRAKCFDFLGRDCYNKKAETLPVRFPKTGFDFFMQRVSP